MLIRYKDKQANFKPPVTCKYVVDTFAPEDSADVLGCFCGGKVVELSEEITKDCTLFPITFQNEEGRRIYERSVRFVMLLAVHRVLPALHVRIEYSIGYGVYVYTTNHMLTTDEVTQIEREMQHIVAQNMPFTLYHWSREKAISYFERMGETDKTRLLAYRKYDYFNIYECGGMAEYFYGAMLPSTGYVKVFSLRPLSPGMVLQLPSPAAPNVPAPYASRPKHLRAFSQSAEWCSILHCTNAADLNELIDHKQLRDFIRVNEALHSKALSDIADQINLRHSRAVFIAGPSSSGKTTFANRLAIQLRVLGLSPVMISLDDFYRDRDTIPQDEHGETDLEAITALDVPYLHTCLEKLLSGQTAMMPRFDFKKGKRKETLVPLRVSPSQPLVIEGIHALNPQLQHGFDDTLLFKIFITELTCLNLDNHNRIRTTDARLLRRIVRDYQFRGTPPEKTLSMWNSVRRGEEKWIFPYQEKADVVFNSALHYELPFLKNIAYEMLKKIPPENPDFFRSRRLLKILHYFVPAPENIQDEIPPLSLLREFIGGCTLYDEDEN